jgi:hypothetical protein
MSITDEYYAITQGLRTDSLPRDWMIMVEQTSGTDRNQSIMCGIMPLMGFRRNPIRL